MSRIFKRLAEVFYRPFLRAYLRSDRYYSRNGLRILVKKGVFHPAFFFSTGFILSELAKEKLEGKSLLELGAGSGLLSFFALQRGAKKVLASDISEAAVEGLKLNKEYLGLSSHLEVIHSDLFNAIPPQEFDYILINPPYYPRDPRSDAEHAWFCGGDYEYFGHLFMQLPRYLSPATMAWLSLSDDCNISRIEAMAGTQGLTLQLRAKKQFLWEMQYLYTLIVSR